MADPRAAKPPTLVSFGTKSRLGGAAAGATLTNDTDIDPVAKAIVTLASGNISVIPADNGSVAIPFVGVPAGWVAPFRVKQVKATGTSVGWATVDDTGV
jgi:hypothetical protein